MLITILLESPPSDLKIFLATVQSFLRLGVQGKCHVIACGVALCLNNMTLKCIIYSESLKYTLSGCEHDIVFLKGVTPGLYILFWLGSTFYRVYLATVVELSKLKPSRVLSSHNYCFRATQDSQSVTALTPELTRSE